MEPPMQLERIRIERLFGRFNHDIIFQKPDNITIIHAPNGFGKTAVLTLLHAFFSRQFDRLSKYNFLSLSLYFNNEEIIEVHRRYIKDLFSEKPIASEEIEIALHSSRRSAKPFKLKPVKLSLNRYLPFLEQTGEGQWLDESSGEIISTTEALARYGDHIPPQYRQEIHVPDWLRSLIDSFECRLIETQRLLRISRHDEDPRVRKRNAAPPRPVVEIEARDLAQRIGATLAEYANRAQSLDQSFPRRVLAALESPSAPLADDVLQRLKNVQEKRLSLIEAGLLDKSFTPDILSQAELVGQQVRQVIGVYLDDVERKFSRFDELFQRVSLFKEFLNEKFQFKTVAISRQKGISVTTEDQVGIELSDLSSGEQHELVLLYELLFGVKDNALILIDEPELSLHVGWQIRFLPDLQRIQKLKPLQIVIATHSPQIINDRWDLTVELKH
jgi:predicted ATP-binding protein involved in virulence